MQWTDNNSSSREAEIFLVYLPLTAISIAVQLAVAPDKRRLASALLIMCVKKLWLSFGDGHDAKPLAHRTVSSIHRLAPEQLSWGFDYCTSGTTLTAVYRIVHFATPLHLRSMAFAEKKMGQPVEVGAANLVPLLWYYPIIWYDYTVLSILYMYSFHSVYASARLMNSFL